MSTQLKSTGAILESLDIVAVSVHQVPDFRPDLTLTITLEPGSSRQIYFSDGTRSSSLNSLTRDAGFYDFVCQVWIRYHKSLLKAISKDISRQMKLKESFLKEASI